MKIEGVCVAYCICCYVMDPITVHIPIDPKFISETQF